MEPERLGVELVHGRPARLDDPWARPRNAIHRRWVQPMKVDGVRVLRAVDEADAKQVALRTAERRAGHTAVVGPRGELHARGDLDLLVGGDELPLAQDPAGRKPFRPAVVE